MSDVEGVSRPVAGQITLRYWAAAASAAGVDEDVLDVERSTTLADLKARARALHDPKFAEVMARCSFLVGDRPSNGDPTQVLVTPGQCVEFLPPFAGG